MHNEVLIPHLFRTEYRKIVSVLCKHFGFEEIETAEDIASDTFLTAMQSWGIEGMPANPVAWLYTVAKNKAKNQLHRRSIYHNKVVPAITNDTKDNTRDIDLSAENISDSQLQMMFAVCNPVIPPEAQIGLALRILCGFGIDEIAAAFLTGKDTINKRLYRAKEKLREEKIKIELPPVTELDERLDTVLATIYLLFNEGYYSASQDKALRKELCFEAIRLCTMLAENKQTHKPSVYALLALMCFHTSRFDARTDNNGELVLYEEQDASLWNEDLVAKGAYFLRSAATGNSLSKYHLEAGIAYWNTQKAETREKWSQILLLYDHLLVIAYSPVAALNRAYALAKARAFEYIAQGMEEERAVEKARLQAIEEAEKLPLQNHHIYHTLLGELYKGLDISRSTAHFEQAIELAPTEAAKRVLRKVLSYRL